VASKDKPYRVYRGGRTRGPIRHEPLKKRGTSRDGDPYVYKGPKAPRKPRRRWLKRGFFVLLVLLVLALVWGILGYLAFRSGVQEANKRLAESAEAPLAPQSGMLLSNPSTILVLGADEGLTRQRGSGRADAIMVLRTDPDENRIALLSIPRDLRVQIPGRGADKINAAYALGGTALTIRTVQSVTGLPVNHVVVVDFGTFGDVVDALGGVTVNVPKPILSNRFECPYSRIRENQLDPSESDISRGERQQAVLQAIADETVSFETYLRGPFIADDLVKPLATDLSAGELTQLAWVKFRTPSDGVLRCRLGGTIADVGGGSYIIGSEENVSVIAMVTGKTAPQPPRPGSGPFGPGCRVGKS
jgi:anionic cell wall polymer biosynthesis LytR-Cps2A-Psr (LCP) family protein